MTVEELGRCWLESIMVTGSCVSCVDERQKGYGTETLTGSTDSWSLECGSCCDDIKGAVQEVAI